jgi:hypothetical protein
MRIGLGLSWDDINTILLAVVEEREVVTPARVVLWNR